MSDDIENEIPVNNLEFSQTSSELRIKIVKLDADGFTNTKLERVKVVKHGERPICITRPLQQFRQISNTICIAVEDLKRATSLEDCWKIFHVCFRRVLLYGKLVVLNEYSKEGKTVYKFSIDDGSDEIIGTMNVTKESKVKVSALAGRLTLERNKLKRKKEIGINIRGIFYPPESDECKSVIDSITNLHHMVSRNIAHQKKVFLLGPVQQKALVMASLYLNQSKEVQLHVIDLSLNDEIELEFKRQLNKLYTNEYLKQSKVVI